MLMTGTVTVETPTGIGDTPALQFELYQNLPNPFTPTTTIGYLVKHPARVEIEIFDVAGRIIQRFRNDVSTPGGYNVQWDGRDVDGKRQSSGVYFYQMKIDGVAVEMKKMVLLK